MLIPMVRLLLQSIVIFSFFLFLKIVKVEFKMKLQSSFCLEFSQVPTKHDSLYLSLHLLEWNDSKLPIFIKIYRIHKNI